MNADFVRRWKALWAIAVLSCGSLLMTGLMTGCGGGSATTWECKVPAGTTKDFVQSIGCVADFNALASVPLVSTIPGARSVKVVFDTFDGPGEEDLYFQNSVKYPIHHDFASEYLSGPAHPTVQALGVFNRTEYSSVERRFILGAVTHYEAPDIWVLQIAPYDTASAAMIEKLYTAVKKAVFFGAKFAFNPTSDGVATESKKLPASVKIITTDTLFESIDYQPLNLATTIGKLRFVKAAELADIYVGFRDIVVLDRVPNDISVVSGMITEQFQTPLSHVNVLAQNRGTPNMGLRAATTTAKWQCGDKSGTLAELQGKWVEFVVGASTWTMCEKTEAEANAWWDINKPPPVKIPDMDLTQTELKNIEDIVDESAPDPADPATKINLGKAIKIAILAYGGKAANYSILAKTDMVPVRKAIAIPVFYYDQFMKQNGFYARVDAMLEDSKFRDDPAIRDAQLAALRADMEKAPVDPTFSALLKAKLEAEFPGMTMRFRTSTNAEDQEDFLCAGCYDSHTGDPSNWDVDRADCDTNSNQGCSVLQAIRKTWSGVWYFRTFEERSYNSIDQKKIGMALLAHHNFAAEEANGVAVTANIFDATGKDAPAFYMNVQFGGQSEVVAPKPGIFSDEALLYYDGNTVSPSYLGHSNLIPKGTFVLNATQILQLARALDAIQKRFSPAYGPASGNNGFYALEVDFKFDDEDNLQPNQLPTLSIKQARNYRGRNN